MPLTKQIIADVVRDVVKSELLDLNSNLNKVDKRITKVEYRLTDVEQNILNVQKGLSEVGQKVDKLTTTVANFAGHVQKFDEEQTVLSSQMSNRTDRIEKLETQVFGSTSI